MRACATAIFSLVFCSALLAEPAHLYVGVAGQWQSVGLHARHQGSYADSRLDDMGIMSSSEHGTGLGEQFECGIAKSFWSVALGFNHHSSCETDGRTFDTGYSYSHWETTELATNDRLLLGIRLQPFIHDPNPVKPVIGIGCSWGWLSRRLEYQNFSRNGDDVSWSIDESTSQRSKGSFGLGFELGLISRVQRALSVYCLGRVDWYASSSESKSTESGVQSMPELTGVHVAALQLGLQYRFRRPRGE